MLFRSDVAAAMMEPPGGRALVEESIAESLDFRRAMRKVDKEYGKDWWFKVWGPEKLAKDGHGDVKFWTGFQNYDPKTDKAKDAEVSVDQTLSDVDLMKWSQKAQLNAGTVKQEVVSGSNGTPGVGLTDDEMAQRILSGSDGLVRNRTGWAMTYLVKVGLRSRVDLNTCLAKVGA